MFVTLYDFAYIHPKQFLYSTTVSWPVAWMEARVFSMKRRKLSTVCVKEPWVENIVKA